MKNTWEPYSFRAWVEFIFDKPRTKEYLVWNYQIPKKTKLKYLIRLFGRFEESAAHRERSIVAKGLRNLIDPGSGDDIFLMFDEGMNTSDRIKAISSMRGVFGYFGKTCEKELLSRRKAKFNTLDYICNSWWDICPRRPQLDAPSRELLEKALFQLLGKCLASNSAVIQHIGLHGYGHWQHDYPEKTRRAINAYLAKHSRLEPQMRRYAMNALEGLVE